MNLFWSKTYFKLLAIVIIVSLPSYSYTGIFSMGMDENLRHLFHTTVKHQSKHKTPSKDSSCDNSEVKNEIPTQSARKDIQQSSTFELEFQVKISGDIVFHFETWLYISKSIGCGYSSPTLHQSDSWNMLVYKSALIQSGSHTYDLMIIEIHFFLDLYIHLCCEMWTIFCYFEITLWVLPYLICMHFKNSCKNLPHTYNCRSVKLWSSYKLVVECQKIRNIL